MTKTAKKRIFGKNSAGKKSHKSPKIRIDSSPFDLVMGGVVKLANERMQSILIQRFGLNNSKPRTLEEIGKKLAITRERVRQIENEALKKLEKSNKINRIDLIIKRLDELLNSYKGIISELRIFNEYSNKKLNELENRSLILLMRMNERYSFLNKPKEFERAWHLKDVNVDIIYKFNEWLTNCLEQRNDVVSTKEIIDLLNKNENLKKLPDNVLEAYVDIPRAVRQNIFGQWGLAHWPQIKPRGVKDKIYLVLKKVGSPLHFSDIAKEVNKLNINNKESCAATVHNELIKDSRFILIGRGIYALREWKYKPGTVADILKMIMRQKKKPLAKEYLVKEVLKQRQVKPTTVALNLQNNKLFERKKSGLYCLKKN